MPKYLYLLRHAESAEKQLHQPDKERELTATGIRQAYQLGDYLLKNNILLDSIITSSASRATATSQLVNDAMRGDSSKIFIEDNLYEASVRTFFDLVTKLDNSYSNIMCVAHNPTITYLAEYLTKAEVGDMATCGLAIIKFNTSNWTEVSQGSGELVNYISPAAIA